MTAVEERAVDVRAGSTVSVTIDGHQVSVPEGTTIFDAAREVGVDIPVLCHNERFDPVRAKRYREGDHDYDNRYGSRDQYKQDYRAAFVQGYEEGYRNVRR